MATLESSDRELSIERVSSYVLSLLPPPSTAGLSLAAPGSSGESLSEPPRTPGRTPRTARGPLTPRTPDLSALMRATEALDAGLAGLRSTMGMPDDGLLGDSDSLLSPRPTPRPPADLPAAGEAEHKLELQLQAELAASQAESAQLRAALAACKGALHETVERAERAEASMRAAAALHAAELDVRDAVLLRMRRREAATAAASAVEGEEPTAAPAASGSPSPARGAGAAATPPSHGGPPLRRRAVSVFAVPGGDDAARGALLRGRRPEDTAASAVAEVSRLEAALRARDAEVGRLSAALAAADEASDRSCTSDNPLVSARGALSVAAMPATPPDTAGQQAAALAAWLCVTLPLWCTLRIAGWAGLRGVLAPLLLWPMFWAASLLWGLSPWGGVPPPACLSRGDLQSGRLPPPPSLTLLLPVLPWSVNGSDLAASSPQRALESPQGPQQHRSRAERRAALSALRAQAAQLVELVARIDAEGAEAGSSRSPSRR